MTSNTMNFGPAWMRRGPKSAAPAHIDLTATRTLSAASGPVVSPGVPAGSGQSAANTATCSASVAKVRKPSTPGTTGSAGGLPDSNVHPFRYSCEAILALYRPVPLPVDIAVHAYATSHKPLPPVAFSPLNEAEKRVLAGGSVTSDVRRVASSASKEKPISGDRYTPRGRNDRSERGGHSDRDDNAWENLRSPSPVVVTDAGFVSAGTTTLGGMAKSLDSEGSLLHDHQKQSDNSLNGVRVNKADDPGISTRPLTPGDDGQSKTVDDQRQRNDGCLTAEGPSALQTSPGGSSTIPVRGNGEISNLPRGLATMMTADLSSSAEAAFLDGCSSPPGKSLTAVGTEHENPPGSLAQPPDGDGLVLREPFRYPAADRLHGHGCVSQEQRSGMDNVFQEVSGGRMLHARLPGLIQPSSGPSPGSAMWVYMDPAGNIQGPFPGRDMHDWYSRHFFKKDLLVKREDDQSFTLLGRLIEMFADSERPFLNPRPALSSVPPQPLNQQPFGRTMFGSAAPDLPFNGGLHSPTADPPAFNLFGIAPSSGAGPFLGNHGPFSNTVFGTGPGLQAPPPPPPPPPPPLQQPGNWNDRQGPGWPPRGQAADLPSFSEFDRQNPLFVRAAGAGVQGHDQFYGQSISNFERPDHLQGVQLQQMQEKFLRQQQRTQQPHQLTHRPPQFPHGQQPQKLGDPMPSTATSTVPSSFSEPVVCSGLTNVLSGCPGDGWGPRNMVLGDARVFPARADSVPIWAQVPSGSMFSSLLNGTAEVDHVVQQQAQPPEPEKHQETGEEITPLEVPKPAILAASEEIPGRNDIEAAEAMMKAVCIETSDELVVEDKTAACQDAAVEVPKPLGEPIARQVMEESVKSSRRSPISDHEEQVAQVSVRSSHTAIGGGRKAPGMAPCSVPLEPGEDAVLSREKRKTPATVKVQLPPSPTKSSPWACFDDDPRTLNAGTPLLREIQAAEAIEAEAARAQEERQGAAALAAEVRKVQEIEAAATRTAWTPPNRSESGPAWQAAQTAKHSLRQIQQEEEERQRAAALGRQRAQLQQQRQAAAADLVAGGVTPGVGLGNKRYADMAANGPAAAVRRGSGSTPAGASAWVTVGGKGAARSAPVAAARPTVDPTRNAGVPSRAADDRKKGLGSSAAPSGPSQEFVNWCRQTLRAVNTANVENLIQMFLTFPPEPNPSTVEIIAEAVYSSSTSINGRAFAEEFVRRRRLDALKPPSAAATGTGSPVSQPQTVGDAGFKVVSKKGRRRN